MNKIFLSLFILCSFSLADNNCSSEYNCTKIPNKDFPLTQSDYHCTIKKMPNMPIRAVDVFDGKNLKTYFGQNQTVCDVLGWMNEGAGKFNAVDGLIGSYKEPITLKFEFKKNSKFGGHYDHRDNSIVFASGSGRGGSILDGTDFVVNHFEKLMKYQTVHEFFHYAQDKTSPNTYKSASDWVNDETPRTDR